MSGAGDLQVFIDKPVNVVTCDGRIIVGILHSFDQAMNLVLLSSHERIFSLLEAVAVVQLGLYLIRGDNVAIVGEIDEERDQSIDYVSIRVEPPAGITH